jgi:hypothetical protein
VSGACPHAPFTYFVVVPGAIFTFGARSLRPLTPQIFHKFPLALPAGRLLERKRQQTENPMQREHLGAAKIRHLKLLRVLVLVAVLSLNTAAFAQVEEASPPVINFQVLQTRRIPVGNRSIIFNRVEPPALPPRPAVVVPQVAAPTGEELNALEESQAKYARKKREALFISATVFNNTVTELYWTHHGRQCHAFSNINFNYFAGLVEFETDDIVC